MQIRNFHDFIKTSSTLQGWTERMFELEIRIWRSPKINLVHYSSAIKAQTESGWGLLEEFSGFGKSHRKGVEILTTTVVTVDCRIGGFYYLKAPTMSMCTAIWRGKPQPLSTPAGPWSRQQTQFKGTIPSSPLEAFEHDHSCTHESSDTNF